MGADNLKFFELNNAVLDDFDKLMSMHLDYVEELKVAEIDANAKILNIISLCINIKKIIIEGDQRVNTNMILSNVCKPEILESIVLKNVKLPSGHTLKKLTGLKSIELENVRFTNIGAFFNEIPKPKKIEEIIMHDSDFENIPIKIIDDFRNLKKLELINVINCEIKDLDFLTTKDNFKELVIKNNIIDAEEINNLLKGEAKKTIECEIRFEGNPKIKDCFEINESGLSSITVNSANLQELAQKVNLCIIDKLTLILEDIKNLNKYIAPLKKAKQLTVIVKDVAQLSQSDAKKIEENLNANTIDMLGADGKEVERSYKIQDYIFIRGEIEKYINQIPEEDSEIKKFLKLYELLSEEIFLDNYLDETTLELDNLKNNLLEKKCLSIDFAKILHNCLACMNIESTIVTGTLTKINEDHAWNQVKLCDYWFNVDIALDCRRVRSKGFMKKPPKYCLLGDKNFYETHTPSEGDINYAESDFNRKALKTYFKTGYLTDNLLKTYIDIFINKIKALTRINKQKALPESTDMHDEDE